MNTVNKLYKPLIAGHELTIDLQDSIPFDLNKASWAKSQSIFCETIVAGVWVKNTRPNYRYFALRYHILS
ncbi:MAG: hypothetical protein EA409_03280 [Saprospirales bacterium]|nr:MAG: hypothetical protein EA409_03280 [Saprospirales bacterium]